ncbi:hypothetical protein ACFL2C_04080 [Patescibacteria group bacterium]
MLTIKELRNQGLEDGDKIRWPIQLSRYGKPLSWHTATLLGTDRFDNTVVAPPDAVCKPPGAWSTSTQKYRSRPKEGKPGHELRKGEVSAQAIKPAFSIYEKV